MTTLPNNIYEFDSLYNAIDFIKPLIVEDYPVVIQKIYGEKKHFPTELECKGFRVEIGPKGEEIKVYVKGEDKEDRFKDANLNEYIKVKLTNKGK